MEFAESIYKKVSPPIVKILIRIGITANQVTVVNFFFTLIFGVYFFSRGTYAGNWMGLGIMFINVVLDYIDGDLARQRNELSLLGKWLDTIGDIILQNSIIAAICFGIYRPGILSAIILIYFVGNSIMHVVSLHYNDTFGFDSCRGNALFRKYMTLKPTSLNRFVKNLIDPTASWIGLSFYTVRYWIIFGIIFNQMTFIFICITIIGTFRWVIMYVLYALHLGHYKKLWVSQALAIIDENRQEYYDVRIHGSL